MHFKIYFNNKPLFLCNEFNEEINTLAHHDDSIFIDEFSNAAVNSMIHEMRLEKVHAGIFYHSELDKLRKAFWKKFTVIQAAGGLVLNEQKQVLFIYRRNKWDLPKGKLDKGETLEQCGVREVKEETGLKTVKLKKFLLTTYHTYDESGHHLLKESHWYTMQAPGGQELVAQAEEQITALKWADPKEIPALAKASFPSIVDVLEAAGYLLK